MNTLIRKLAVTVAGLCLAGAAVAPAAAQDAPPAKETVAQRLDRLERLLNSKGLLDMLQQIQQLQQEVRELRGQLEVEDHKLDQLSERQRNLYADVDQRLRKLRQGGGGNNQSAAAAGGGDNNPPLDSLAPVTGPAQSSSTPGDNLMTLNISSNGGGNAGTASGQAATSAAPQPASSQPAPAQSGTAAGTQTAMAGQSASLAQTDAGIQPAGVEQARDVSPVQIQAQYQEAFGLLKQSQYEQAIQAFRKFLAAYPDSDYADNAQYWLAEAYYVTRDFDSALKEYRKLVQAYPNSQKYTGGLLKIGYTLQELGKLDEARKQLQELVQKYPGTTAARLAQDRLQRLNAAAAAGNTKAGAPAPQQ